MQKQSFTELKLKFLFFGTTYLIQPKLRDGKFIKYVNY